MNWFALNVAPQREFTAEAILRERGYNVFVPLVHRSRNAHRRSKVKVLTAVPYAVGYILVGFNDDEDPPWLDIMALQMIIGVVGHFGTPLPLLSEHVRILFQGTTKPIRYVNARHKQNYGKAYKADIISGPFEGRRVRVIEYTTDQVQRRLMKGEVFEMYELFKAKEAA